MRCPRGYLRLEPDPRAVLDELRAAEDHAELLLKGEWDRVRKLAASLQRRKCGRMTAKQVRGLIGGTPPLTDDGTNSRTRTRGSSHVVVATEVEGGEM